MTAAMDERVRPSGGAVRCARAVVVALLAALAVLVHHDTTSMAMPARAMSAMAGMGHDTGHAGMTATPTSTVDATALRTVDIPMDRDDGACSGSAMQHCSAGDIGTAKLVPPADAVTVGRSHLPPAAFAGHRWPGRSHRAPPDLSLLSRLLI
ncbi:hypothetical protein ACIRJO_25170 [Streptomyces sp. NPDC102394]|uniref:hypothetical protein n=1 Tax=Streptomyces sp. NPDC102394 TaxID=3366167 RepID=UPI003828EFFB